MTPRAFFVLCLSVILWFSPWMTLTTSAQGVQGGVAPPPTSLPIGSTNVLRNYLVNGSKAMFIGFAQDLDNTGDFTYLDYSLPSGKSSSYDDMLQKSRAAIAALVDQVTTQSQWFDPKKAVRIVYSASMGESVGFESFFDAQNYSLSQKGSSWSVPGLDKWEPGFAQGRIGFEFGRAIASVKLEASDRLTGKLLLSHDTASNPSFEHDQTKPVWLLYSSDYGDNGAMMLENKYCLMGGTTGNLDIKITVRLRDGKVLEFDGAGKLLNGPKIAISFSGQSVTLTTIGGNVGDQIVIQTSSDLKDWSDWQTNNLPYTYTVDDALSNQKFYRIKQ